MLTRSKQRALAAQSQPLEGRKGHEGPSLEMKRPADWSELPAELLMMVFDNLKIEPWPAKEQRTPLLNCRLVHPRWKSAMDDLLEKRNLSFWKKWKQPEDNHYKFPVVYFTFTGKNTLENILFPPFLERDLESCPFPTKSVYLSYVLSCRNSWTTSPKGDAHFFSEYGRHLTSLTIELIYMMDFPASTLQQLLTCTPHLKAISLVCLTIILLEKDVGKILLPPLPQLEYMRLISIYCREFKIDAQNWILDFYKEQLISVRCKEELVYENSAANFPLLKNLHIYGPRPRQLLAPVVFPSLQSLELMMIYLNEDSRQLNLEHVFRFLARVASTLVELQLDIFKKTNPINYEKDQSLQELQKIQQNRFPSLKTLTIFYPKFEEEVKVVKDFLKMFPNLETLNFTKFNNYGKTPTELHGRVHVQNEKYEGVCPKLRTISVYKMDTVARPFFSYQFPVSACRIYEC